MARSTNMSPTWTSGVLWKGKNEKHVIPHTVHKSPWLLRQNKPQTWPEVQRAPPALGPILPLHSTHLLNTYYMLTTELTNEDYD